MTGPNTSSAVMARRVEPADSLDDFPTPPWGTRALCEYLRGIGVQTNLLRVREPACNRGHMARVLGEYFDRVQAWDVHDYGWPGQERVCDYLFEPAAPIDWTITNPPFRLASEFLEHALTHSREGVALLLRTTFLEGIERSRLFAARPPALVLVFSERLPMFRGRLDGEGSTATSYAWFVWDLSGWWPGDGARIDWTGVCRRRLERPGDYPEARVEALPPGGLFEDQE